MYAFKNLKCQEMNTHDSYYHDDYVQMTQSNPFQQIWLQIDLDCSYEILKH